ncbi:MAG: hypothetical protein HY714_05145 [Candidatus Omnitrophica bacterium]|nr:hypothetical protein [Candidatus Omnitrophota bacterium]
MSERKDPFGFWFWLGWIVWFAVSLVLAAVVWTRLLDRVFGRIEGIELTATWSLAVFGTWFLFLVPFIRKKEQIWKRLNDDQEAAVDAWLIGLSAFIASGIGATFFWSLKLRGTPWLKAVTVTWLALMIPGLLWMYRAAGRIFKSAESRQGPETRRYRKQFVPRNQRLIPEPVSEKIKRMSPTLPKGHVVTVLLKSGVRIPGVFIYDCAEVLGVYDRDLDFNPAEIEDAELTEPGRLPAFEESKWLRLDG